MRSKQSVILQFIMSAIIIFQLTAVLCDFHLPLVPNIVNIAVLSIMVLSYLNIGITEHEYTVYLSAKKLLLLQIDEASDISDHVSEKDRDRKQERVGWKEQGSIC